MPFQKKLRIGLVVPPQNAAAEPEFGELVRAAANSHVMRFPFLPELDLAGRLRRYNDVLPETLAGFGEMRLNAAVVACTGSHYLLGPAADRSFCGELGDRYGMPVASAAIAILETCQDLGLEEITLVSPYQPWLTEHSVAYWEAAGIAVRDVVKVRAGERFSPYDVGTAELVAQVRSAGLARATPLLFTGTGMFTLAALDELRADGFGPMLTSNICSARWALGAATAEPSATSALTRLVGAP